MNAIAGVFMMVDGSIESSAFPETRRPSENPADFVVLTELEIRAWTWMAALPVF